MRTIDPELWSTKIKKRHQIRALKFGQNIPYNLETCLRQSFCDTLDEFWRNCSVVAVKYINNGYFSKFEKLQRISLTLVIVCCGVFVVLFNWHRFRMTPPLFESLVTDQYSISEMQFPAIALCSTNIINKTALNNYVEFLASKDRNNTYTRKDIEGNLLTFGTLLTMGVPSTPVDVMFMQFLGELQPDFNVTDIMYRLSPQCESLLVRCSWAGKITPCEDLFATRITSLGFCCVFNSRYQPEDWDATPKILKMIGPDNGLSVVFKENSDEFAFVRSAVAGVQVLVFDGSEYPLLEGGAVRMYPLKQNTSVFIPLSVREEQPSDTLQYYNELWRGCRLRVVEPPRDWRSSYSWCLSLCRASTAASVCSCRPYTLPQPQSATLPVTVPVPGPHYVCSLNQLACLNKHKEKLVYYYPGYVEETVGAGLDEEMQNAQDCLHCLPDCSRLLYTADLFYSPHLLHLHGKTLQNFFLKGLPFINVTTIQIFYPTEDQSLYAVESYFRWYEVVSIISGQWVCLVGVSIISAAELVFHLVFRWPLHFMRRRRRVGLAAQRSRSYH